MKYKSIAYEIFLNYFGTPFTCQRLFSSQLAFDHQLHKITTVSRTPREIDGLCIEATRACNPKLGTVRRLSTQAKNSDFPQAWHHHTPIAFQQATTYI